MEALKAGAMAVKMYGWYHVKYPKYPAWGADVDNTINSQVYKLGSNYWKTNDAVDAIHGLGFRRNWKWIDPFLFETSYYAGTYDGSRTDGEHMTQNGSHYWADQGKTYSWILTYYYDSSDQYVFEEFFNY
ncbi:MAG: SpoIID/LytB domain-containing protein [Thermoanaerobacteraceae bacterium]|nr:SpoIID/LytB domain-containing protein [Thermoanaerobacteraceae bacterium]